MSIDKLTLIMEACNAIVDNPKSPEHDKNHALEIQAWADDCKPLLAALQPLADCPPNSSDMLLGIESQHIDAACDAIAKATE